MIAFIIRRLMQSIIVMGVVGFVAFSLFQFVGDPVLAMVGQDATPEQRAELRRDLGLDDPIPVQFAHFVVQAVQGDFGMSYRQSRKVSTLLKERFPATMELSIVAALLALVVGIPMGVYTALRRKGWLANLLLAYTEGRISQFVRSEFKLKPTAGFEDQWQFIRSQLLQS
jgi:peptide/nickel transport system permease protein